MKKVRGNGNVSVENVARVKVGGFTISLKGLNALFSSKEYTYVKTDDNACSVFHCVKGESHGEENECQDWRL